MPKPQEIGFSSAIDPSFWQKLSEVKIDQDKLNETERPVWGYHFNVDSKPPVQSPLLVLDSTSFNKSPDNSNTAIPLHGTLLNKNNYQEFKNACNQNLELLKSTGTALLGKIRDGSALENPSILNSFFFLTFADLKKFIYYYWLAYPTPTNFKISVASQTPVSGEFDEEQVLILFLRFRNLEWSQKPFFLIEKTEEDPEGYIVHKHSSKLADVSGDDYEKFYFVYCDIATENKYGRMLKNYILFILHHCPSLQGKTVKFLSLRLTRDKHSCITCVTSLIYEIKLPVCDNEGSEISSLAEKWKGWELNSSGQFSPRIANMMNSMDPKILAENAVDLNLKLMKWRLLPEIDLEKIKNARCLLIGAGTLGCSVSRVLLGWGVRTIDFVDNSTVSLSNPVRQSLFTFQDSVDSRPKAVAAADNLKLIFPGILSRGHQLHIPMPDHPIGESLLEEAETSVSKLVSLIKDHDVVFILTDSRESRWLPTLLGAYFNKVVINAALGFDSYLIMRHGTTTPDLPDPEVPPGFKAIKANDLGCYFCSDVIAPGNTMKDRSLDQQCTVIRPGVSAIAGAMAVELTVSILQHPAQGNAPAFYRTQDSPDDTFRSDECILGVVPHSIRGFLSSYSHMLPASPKFKQCTACSEVVLQEYGEKGFRFLLQVFNCSKHLAELTKLEEMQDIEEDISSYSEDESFSS